MDTQNAVAQMVALMDCPSFCVLDGVIAAVNQGAADVMIRPGQRIADLIGPSQKVYSAFSGGELSLTVQTKSGRYAASVHAVGNYHIFKLNPENIPFQVLGLAARQLRNPLSSVMAMADQLFPNLQIPEDSPAGEQLSRINRGLNVLHRIICNMSDAGRYTESAPRMELRDVDAILRELCEEAQTLCDFTAVRLEYSGLNTAAYTMVDTERLERCFYNIASNSIKAMPNGGVIRIRLTRQANVLYMTVQDSGSGLTGTSAFDRHLRRNTLEDSRAGLGLGMQLIRACAEAHGGSVIVESREGEGLRLTMSMAVRMEDTQTRTPTIDYGGERSHGLMELAESLPHTLYKPEKKH